MYFILAMVVIGMVAGGIASKVVYPEWRIDWTEAFVVGLGGSFLGGITANIITGNGFSFGVSGLIGSTIMAIILLAIVKWVRGRAVAAAASLDD